MSTSRRTMNNRTTFLTSFLDVVYLLGSCAANAICTRRHGFSLWPHSLWYTWMCSEYYTCSALWFCCDLIPWCDNTCLEMCSERHIPARRRDYFLTSFIDDDTGTSSIRYTWLWSESHKCSTTWLFLDPIPSLRPLSNFLLCTSETLFKNLFKVIVCLVGSIFAWHNQSIAIYSRLWHFICLGRALLSCLVHFHLLSSKII